MKRIGMNDTKDILRQRHGLDLTRDRIATGCGASPGAVSHVLERARRFQAELTRFRSRA